MCVYVSSFKLRGITALYQPFAKDLPPNIEQLKPVANKQLTMDSKRAAAVWRFNARLLGKAQ